MSPRVHILTPCTYSHLACSPPPPPLKVISHPTSCAYSHLACSPPPPLLKFTSCPPHIHLTCIFSPHVHILTSHAPLHLHHSKSPRMHILTSHTYSHLVYSPPPPLLKVTSCPPCMHILTSHAPLHLHHSKSPRVHILTSRTYSHLACVAHIFNALNPSLSNLCAGVLGPQRCWICEASSQHTGKILNSTSKLIHTSETEYNLISSQ